jgi:hypothetical protein
MTVNEKKALPLYTLSQKVKVLVVFFKNPEIFLKIFFAGRERCTPEGG